MFVISYCCRKNGKLFYGMKLWHEDVVEFVELLMEDDIFTEVCILWEQKVKDDVELERWQLIIN